MSSQVLFQIQLVLVYLAWLLCFGVYLWPPLKAAADRQRGSQGQPCRERDTPRGSPSGNQAIGTPVRTRVHGVSNHSGLAALARVAPPG
jgi:hypothetical protein